MNNSFSHYYDLLSSEANESSRTTHNVSLSYSKLERAYECVDPKSMENISLVIIMLIRHYYLSNGGSPDNLAPFNPVLNKAQLEYPSKFPDDLERLICYFIDKQILVK